MPSSKTLLVREYEWVMESVRGRIERALGLVLLQMDGQMGEETSSKTIRQHSHVLQKAKVPKEKKTATQQNPSVIKYVPSDTR